MQFDVCDPLARFMKETLIKLVDDMQKVQAQLKFLKRLP